MFRIVTKKLIISVGLILCVMTMALANVSAAKKPKTAKHKTAIIKTTDHHNDIFQKLNKQGGPALAALKSSRKSKLAQKSYSANITPSRTYSPTQSELVIDAQTGKILHASNPKERVFPASLTKVMTAYIVFDALEAGKLSLNDRISVSSNAEKMRPSKLGLKNGETILVKDAIMAIIVKSANDAAVTLAEAIAGSEENFVKIMNRRARQIGMSDTNFANASGWHNPMQRTTAVDLTKLALAIKRDHAKFFPWFSRTSFEFRGKTINGHNRVVANYQGADGLKTGYTIPSGFNLITTASRGDKSLVAVITGGRSGVSRDQMMMRLLDKHFGVMTATNDTKKEIRAAKAVKLASSSHSKSKRKTRIRT